MSYFKVTILGCGSATPTLRHFPSAQAVEYRNRIFLVDCGEGTQLQMRRFGLSYAKVTDIFISHLHGDHFLGLPGLLSTMALHGVEGTVTVHVFKEGAEILQRIMDVFCRPDTFEIRYDIIAKGESRVLFEDGNLQVECFPLYHRVACSGFIFREKTKQRHLKGEVAKFYGVPHWRIPEIKAGADYVLEDGTVVPNRALTSDADPAMSYAYCSDTAFDERVARAVSGVDVLYHEATYGDDSEYKAAPRGHSTARQAAKIAVLAGVRRLVIGHYSKTYKDSAVLASEAREVFADVADASEGMVIELC